MTEPDASLGGRDTHTSPITIRELLGEAIFLSLNAGTRMEVVRTIKAALAQIKTVYYCPDCDEHSEYLSDFEEDCRVEAYLWARLPDPVAGSPGAP